MFIIPRLFILIAVCLYFSCISGPSQAHPQDEDIILDIEQGQLQFDEEKIEQEYLSALKRQRMRKVAQMPMFEQISFYIAAGVTHIIPKGLDHILFVLGLFFSTTLLIPMVWQISAFTLAHTITLGLAIQGLVQVPSNIVEPLIALSIVYIAYENIRFSEPSKSRLLLIFIFGLLHGLGFASVLVDYGLPKDSLLTALFAFNIGVEIGQVLVIAIAAILFFWFFKAKWYRLYTQIPASIVIGSFGIFWLFERI